MDNKELCELFDEIMSNLSGEQKKKLEECGSMEEGAALLGKLGVELPAALLDAVAGGSYAQTGEYDDDEWEWQGPSEKYPNPFQFWLRISS